MEGMQRVMLFGCPRVPRPAYHTCVCDTFVILSWSRHLLRDYCTKIALPLFARVFAHNNMKLQISSETIGPYYTPFAYE